MKARDNIPESLVEQLEPVYLVKYFVFYLFSLNAGVFYLKGTGVSFVYIPEKYMDPALFIPFFLKLFYRIMQV